MISLRTILFEYKFKFELQQKPISELPDSLASWKIRFKGDEKGDSTIDNAIQYFTPANVSSSTPYYNKDHVFVIKTKREGNRKVVFYIGAYPVNQKPSSANTQVGSTTSDGVSFWVESPSVEQTPIKPETSTTTSANLSSEPKVSTTTDTTNSTTTSVSKPVQIKYGMRGDEVEVAQNYLIRKLEKTPIVNRPEWKKFMSYGADGKYGDATGRLVWGLHKVYGLTPSKNLTPELIAKLETIQESIKLKTLREQNWDAFDTTDYVSTKKTTTPKPGADSAPAAEISKITLGNVKVLEQFLLKQFPENFKQDKFTNRFKVRIGNETSDNNIFKALKKNIISKRNTNEEQLLNILKTLPKKWFATFHAEYSKTNNSELFKDLDTYAFDSSEINELMKTAMNKGFKGYGNTSGKLLIIDPNIPENGLKFY